MKSKTITTLLLAALLLAPLAALHAADRPLQRLAGVPSSHPYSETRRKRTDFSERRQPSLPAAVTPSNGTSLSVEPGSRIQPIAIGRGLSYHPL